MNKTDETLRLMRETRLLMGRLKLLLSTETS